MVKNHEACAYDPDNQQNLPRFHITLPFQLKQCDPTKKLVHQVDGKTAVPQAVHKRQSANNAASDLMRQVRGASAKMSVSKRLIPMIKCSYYCPNLEKTIFPVSAAS